MRSARNRGAIPPGPEADAVAQLIIACALCEGGALAAVVVFLLTGSPLALVPYALSWLGLGGHFPGDRHWAQLTAGEKNRTESSCPRAPARRRVRGRGCLPSLWVAVGALVVQQVRA